MNKMYINSIFDKELTYYDEYESFCYQNCLRMLLEAKKIDNSWLYINSCSSMYYDNNLAFRYHDGVRGLISSLNDKVERIYENGKTKEQVFKENCEYISSHDEVIVVGADTYFLPYATNYQKNHAKHTLIMCGYDLDKKLVYIIDWYSPWFYKGTIALSDFLLARNSANEYDGSLYSGGEIRNNWAHLIDFKVEELDPILAMKEVLNESINNYYCDDKLVGANGLELFVKDFIKELNTNYDKDRITSLYKHLIVLSKRHKFLVRYLINLKDNFQMECEDLINLQLVIIAKWDSFLMILLKTSMVNNEKTIARFEHSAKALIELENEFKNRIKAFIFEV